MKGLARLPWSLTAVLLAAVHVTAVPSVNVQMRAAFPAGPYLLELLETAALEDSSVYFPLLDRIADGAFAVASTEKELYDRFLAVLAEDSHLTESGALSSFKLSLSLRTAAPRIEAHYQYYDTAIQHLGGTQKEECETWVARGDYKYCDEDLSSGTKLAIELALKELPPFISGANTI
jgi:UDP-glucose:glycoprotein glucosyltransferase